MTEYALWVRTPAGTQSAIVDRFTKLEYGMTTNQVGALTLTLPGGDASPFVPDARIEVQRRPSGGAWMVDMDQHWLVRSVVTKIAASGERSVEVRATSALELLARRVVPYALASFQGSKRLAADDLVKALVRENLSYLSVDTTRSLAAYITAAADTGAAATVSKQASYRNLLQTVQEVASDAVQADPTRPLLFDVIWTGTTFEFRTWIRQRGADRSGTNQLILGPAFGTLADVEWGEDRLDEITAVYAAGQGIDTTSARPFDVVTDAARLADSPFNRRERWLDTRNADTSVQRISEGNAALREGRPRRVLSGTIVETAGARYGVDWTWGDKVLAQLDAQTMAAIVETVTVTVAAGSEKVAAKLRADDV